MFFCFCFSFDGLRLLLFSHLVKNEFAFYASTKKDQKSSALKSVAVSTNTLCVVCVCFNKNSSASLSCVCLTSVGLIACAACKSMFFPFFSYIGVLLCSSVPTDFPAAANKCVTIALAAVEYARQDARVKVDVLPLLRWEHTLDACDAFCR